MFGIIKKIFLFTYTQIISRINHVKLGRGVIIYPTSTLSIKLKLGVNINDGTRIGCFAKGYSVGFFHRTRIITLGSGKISIGNYCEINGANICSKSKITIGNKVQIASGVQITDYNAHSVYSYNRHIERDDPCPISIGNNVWIGLNAIILKGSIIGDNSVVAAGSVVKGVFPSYSIIQGNPAVVVKKLSPDKFRM